MKHVFTILCWAVMALGVLLACSRKPVPEPPAPASVPYPEKSGDVITLPDPEEVLMDFLPSFVVHFALNDADPVEQGALREAAQALRRHGATALITGHACPLGEEGYNEALSARRAVAVVNHLEALGLPISRLQVRTRGEREPMAREPREYWKNRRVVIELVKEME